MASRRSRVRTPPAPPLGFIAIPLKSSHLSMRPVASAQYLRFIVPAEFCATLVTVQGPPVSNSRMGASWRITAHGMSDLAQSLPWGRDESELITELQAGSEAAFDWLVTYYHAGVYNLVYGILADSADAAHV